MTGWAAFWLLCAVVICCDYAVFKSGADGAFWQYKTPPELVLQQKIIAGKVSQP